MIKIKVDSENTNMLTKAYSKIDHEKEEKHKQNMIRKRDNLKAEIFKVLQEDYYE